MLGSRVRLLGLLVGLAGVAALANPAVALNLPGLAKKPETPPASPEAARRDLLAGSRAQVEEPGDEEADAAGDDTLTIEEAAPPPPESPELRIDGSFGVAMRVYPDDAPYPGQTVDHVYPYAFGTLNLAYDITDKDKLQTELYARAAPFSSYSLFDARRAYYLHTAGTWDFLMGINTVAWGVTESRHLIDVINQRDPGGNLDDDTDRLGQPMANLNLISPDWGTLSLYGLFGFRELDLPEPEDRLRQPFIISESDSQLGGEDWEHVVNFAGRYTNSFSVFGGGLDVGVSGFHGLSRDPRLVLAGPPPKVIPIYDIMNQIGVESVYAIEDLQLKFEGLSRWQNGEQYYAAVSGFEYTLHDILNGAADVGLLAEYLYDGRSSNQPSTPFDNDVFGGLRISLNNVGSTRILSGVIVDVDDQSTFGSLEFEHRLRDDVLLTLDARTFMNIPAGDYYNYLSTESFVELGLTKFF